jgi:hypothetical protein
MLPQTITCDSCCSCAIPNQGLASPGPTQLSSRAPSSSPAGPPTWTPTGPPSTAPTPAAAPAAAIPGGRGSGRAVPGAGVDRASLWHQDFMEAAASFDVWSPARGVRVGSW